MRKIKISLTLVAALAAAGSAVATRPDPFCEDYPQYHLSSGRYTYAGQYGVDFFCDYGGGTCTYYQPTLNTFLPCMDGNYVPISLKKDGKQSKAAR